MSELAWYEQTMERYDANAFEAEAFEEFKRDQPDAYSACFQAGKEKAAADLDGIWEAVSVQGVVYPPAVVSHESRLIFDDYVALSIARAALKGDATTIGRIIMQQVDKYLTEKGEEFVAENWREWA